MSYVSLISVTQAEFNALKTAGTTLDRPVAFFITDAAAGAPNIIFGRQGQTATTAQTAGAVAAGSSSSSGMVNNFAATTAPTAGDDSADGYAVGSRWVDVTGDESYICLDATVGAAIWSKTTVGTIAEVAGLQAALDLKAPLASPVLTGTPTVPTAATATNTTQAASTAFVQAVQTAGLATIASPMNGAAAVGTATTMARQDHVHASDTTKANVASPTFTGTPAAPTAAAGTSTTQIATTAFVQTEIAADLATVAPSNVASAAVVGTSTNMARQDHVHTISAGVVTNAMLATMPANTVMVNNTASAAAPVNLLIGANQVIGRNSAGNMLGLPVTDAAWSLLDDTTAAAMRTTLGAEATLVSGTNIKTVNGSSILGAGNVVFPAASSTVTRLWDSFTDGTSDTLQLRTNNLPASGSIATWTDVSNSASNATQAVTTSQPAVSTTLINGLAPAVFDTNDVLRGSASLFGGAFSVFFVAKSLAGAVFRTLLGNDTTAANGTIAFGKNSSDQLTVYKPFVTDSTGTKLTLPAGDTAFLASFTSAGVSAGNLSVTPYLNGTAGSPLSLTGVTAGTGYSVGAFTGSGGSADFWNGVAAEILVFSTAMSDSDRSKVEGYLAWKYGLQASLPAGHTFKSAAPTAVDIPVYANNAAAIAGGLVVGRLYRGGGDPDTLYVVH